MTEKCEQAFRDYNNGMKYKDIAEKHNVSLSAVKSWAARYWKPLEVATKEKKVATSKDKKLQPKSRGAPKGNKNAAGNKGGAPEGNTNNYKHGIYETIQFDFLDDEERKMLEQIGNIEEELELEKQIATFSIRERRLLKSIQEKKETKGGLTLDSVVSRKLEIDGNIVHGEKQVQKETTTKTISTIEIILRLEAELTRVQSKKTRCIEALNKLRLDRQRLMEDQKGDEVVNEWVGVIEDDD